MEKCPVCGVAALFEADKSSWQLVACGNCGRHRFHVATMQTLLAKNLSESEKARLAFGVRKVPSDESVEDRQVWDMLKEVTLPPAMERLERLIIYMAEFGEPGHPVPLNYKWLQASLGCENPVSSKWVLDTALNLRYLEKAGSVSDEFFLAMTGWEKYHKLMRDGAGSKRAFMAMKFGDPQIDAFYEQMKVAVKQTDFDLRATFEDHKTADLIDNRMRVEMRMSRFVVCDLTHRNLGAYWEAGFAEGLRRPVFYVCRQDQLSSRDPDIKPHFDTNHQTIIGWDPAKPEKALAELKAMIRATLPDEAKLHD